MQISFKNILAPTDFSELAGNAMTTAIEMCKRHNATLHMMHVLENQSLMAPPESNVPVFFNVPETEAAARKNLAAISEKIKKKHKIPVTTYLEFGLPVNAIKLKAVELACEIIILGTHGASGFRELFIGSTAFTLIRNTTIPVLTVPGKKKVKEFGKILFPIRAAKGIIEKYDFIKPIIKENDAELLILGLSLSSEIFDMEDRKKELLQMGESLGINNFSFRSEFHVCRNYAREVLKMAKKEKVNLIVINTTLDYNWREFFIGPYAQQIVNHAQVPVLSIRTAESLAKSDDADLQGLLHIPAFR